MSAAYREIASLEAAGSPRLTGPIPANRRSFRRLQEMPIASPHAGGPLRPASAKMTSGPAVLKRTRLARAPGQPLVEQTQAQHREKTGRVLELGSNADQPVVAGRDRAQPLRQLVSLGQLARLQDGPEHHLRCQVAAPPAARGRRTRPPRAAAPARREHRRSADRADGPPHRTVARRPARRRARRPSATSVIRPARDRGRARPRREPGSPWRARRHRAPARTPSRAQSPDSCSPTPAAGGRSSRPRRARRTRPAGAPPGFAIVTS